jgi:4-hydroxy-tetrahydrodipicolinate synthase
MVDTGRLMTAMVTPFTPDGAVDYAQARRLAVALVDSGSDSIVVCGTTGEAPTLKPDEKLRLFSEVKDALGDRAAVVAGSGDNCTEDSVELSLQAQRTGVDALLLTVPYYNKPRRRASTVTSPRSPTRSGCRASSTTSRAARAST